MCDLDWKYKDYQETASSNDWHDRKEQLQIIQKYMKLLPDNINKVNYICSYEYISQMGQPSPYLWNFDFFLREVRPSRDLVLEHYRRKLMRYFAYCSIEANFYPYSGSDLVILVRDMCNGNHKLVDEYLQAVMESQGEKIFENTVKSDFCCFSCFFKNKSTRKMYIECVQKYPWFYRLYKRGGHIFQLIDRKEIKIVKMFADRNMIRSLRDENGNTLLLRACFVRGRVDKLVKWLIMEKSDINVVNQAGKGIWETKNKHVQTLLTEMFKK